MYRFYDWRCTNCKAVTEHLVDVPDGKVPPKGKKLECPWCEGDHPHVRLLSVPAEVHCDKVHNPKVMGGEFDTLGHRPLPKLPELGGHDSNAVDRSLSQKLACVSDNAPPEVAHEIVRAHNKDKGGPELCDYKKHFESSDWKFAKLKQDEVKEQNRQKKARRRALERGEPVNMRRDKCAGDPSFA